MSSVYKVCIVVHLLSGFGRGKLIENESFLRSFRPASSEFGSHRDLFGKDLNIVPTTTFTTISSKNQTILDNNKSSSVTPNISLSKSNTTNITLVAIYRKAASNSSETITDLNPHKKMQRKMDTIQNDIQNRNKFFYAMNPRNESNFQLNPLPKYYINYRQAYGIRYEPSKIRRSFNFESAVSNNVGSLVDPNAENDVVENEIEETLAMTTTMPNLEESLTTEMADDFQMTEVEMNPATTSAPTSTTGVGILEIPTTPKPVPTQVSNVMIPSHVQSAIQLINNRVNSLVTYDFGYTKNSQRFLNLFKVIKFKNVPCSSHKAPLTPLNGTCYSQSDCDQLGGVVVDECASGFGVCCVFQYECGGVTKQSISYFKTPNFPDAYTNRLSCTMTLQLWPNVKSVLLEFLFFELLPPIEGSCSDDQFLITGQNVNSPVPIFCGINSGQHIYLDVEGVVDRKIVLSALADSVAPRAFNIRLSQFEERVAPQGCLQYFTEPTGFIQTFNYEDSAEVVQLRKPSYFNNLNYAICIRRSMDLCVITYSNQIGNLEFEFQLTNVDSEGTSVIPPAQAGAEIFNCADDFIALNGIRLCGERLNDASITEDYTVNAPVSDFSAGPIILPVRTNADVVGRGFKLYYEQQPCYI